MQALRTRQHETDSDLERARGERDRTRSELMSLEALQKAALGEADRDAGKWLAAAGLAGRPRVTAHLEVEKGWERGVESVLGDALEAVHVESLDAAAARLADLGSGHLMLVEGGQDGRQASDSLAARVRGPQAVMRRLARVGTAASLQEALQKRHALGAGESLVTADGIWVGRDWLRVSRGRDAHAGVLERESRIRALRGVCETCESAVQSIEQRPARPARRSVGRRSRARQRAADRSRARIANIPRPAVRWKRRVPAASRQRCAWSASTAKPPTCRSSASAPSRRWNVPAHALDEASVQLAQLESRRSDMEAEREERRATATAAREAAQQARAHARELLIQLEGRRSTESSLGATLVRMQEQRAQLDDAPAAARSRVRRRRRAAAAPGRAS